MVNFDCNVCAPSDQRALGQRLKVERLVRGDREFVAGDVRLLRPGAGGDENVLGGDGFAVDFDFVSSTDKSFLPKNRNAGVHQGALVDAVQPVDLAVLVGEQPGPVEGRRGDAPAEVGGVLKVVAEVGGVGKQLLRDAADVDAGAAKAARLGDCDARAQVAAEAARANAARTAAYGEKIVVVLQDAPRLTSGATSGSSDSSRRGRGWRPFSCAAACPPAISSRC